MIVFQSSNGEQIVYFETRWAKENVFPQLMHSVEKGLLTIVSSTL